MNKLFVQLSEGKGLVSAPFLHTPAVLGEVLDLPLELKGYEGQAEYLRQKFRIVPSVLVDRIQSISQLGERPEWVDPYAILLNRVPSINYQSTDSIPGLDMGVALMLGLVPEDKKLLGAKLHANYTPDVVDQARRESDTVLDIDSETAYWLAACGICDTNRTTVAAFGGQVDLFRQVVVDTDLRRTYAEKFLNIARTSFQIKSIGDISFAYGEKEGCIQGAYLAGHRFGVERFEINGEEGYAIGTYMPTLGLENGFKWPEGGLSLEIAGMFGLKDNKPGGVGGSQQFVVCATEEQMLEAVKYTHIRLGDFRM